MPLRLSLQTQIPCPHLPARSTLRRWVLLALQDTPQANLTLRLVGTDEARRLNRRFRAKTYAPNVLTFNYSAPPQLHADLVLCLPVIEREARAQHKTFRAHLAHLIIHGVLHARGFDHLRPAQTRRMEALEIHLLAALRIANPYESTPLTP